MDLSSLRDARWRRSSYTNADGGNCLEVAEGVLGVVPVRDSKRSAGAVLFVPADAWDAFIDSLRG
ncbi:DUF397 domain-containing protein [Streptomyces sp. SBT349]|uniref:DUF397 domain-containing protein n=1 Tax=Streptomyces sp. SBT349 TaxID=1580539 RepID=UPI00066DAEA6|nr:DUF397 domain-containing protein [Streptomyces sp. SBT349]